MVVLEIEPSPAFGALPAVALEHEPPQLGRNRHPLWLPGFLGAHQTSRGLKYLLLPALALQQESLEVVSLKAFVIPREAIIELPERPLAVAEHVHLLILLGSENAPDLGAVPALVEDTPAGLDGVAACEDATPSGTTAALLSTRSITSPAPAHVGVRGALFGRPGPPWLRVASCAVNQSTACRLDRLPRSTDGNCGDPAQPAGRAS